jgi:hypothetical protein
MHCPCSGTCIVPVLGTRIAGHPVLQVIRYQKVLQSTGTYTVISTCIIRTHAPCHPVPILHVIQYSVRPVPILRSSGTPSHPVPEGSTSHPVLTLHVIRYSHSISSSTHNSTHPVLECSRNHPVPKCSRSSGTSINNNLVLEIIQNFGKFLEENRVHGFCPEPCLHAEM